MPAAWDQAKWMVVNVCKERKVQKPCAEKGWGPLPTPAPLRQPPLSCASIPPPPPHTQVSAHEKARGVGGGWPNQGTCPTGLGAGGQTGEEPAGSPRSQNFLSLFGAPNWGWVKSSLLREEGEIHR